MIFQLGVAFGQGKDGLDRDSQKAFQLYLFSADTLGFGLGFYHCALYYYDGRQALLMWIRHISIAKKP